MSTLAIDSAHPRPSLWTDTLNQPPSLSLFWELYSDVEAVVYCITNDGRREGSRSSTSKRSEAQIKPELLPRLFKGSKPSIVTSWDTSKTAAALLKRSNVKQTTHFHSKQAEILAELLGGATATWQLTSVMLPTGCGKKSNGCASSSTYIYVQARVLYIVFFHSRQVCFKLTADNIETLTKYHTPPKSSRPSWAFLNHTNATSAPSRAVEKSTRWTFLRDYFLHTPASTTNPVSPRLWCSSKSAWILLPPSVLLCYRDARTTGAAWPLFAFPILDDLLPYNG
jgi:hypothetical protein